MEEVETCRRMGDGETSLEEEVKSSGMEVEVREMVEVETCRHMVEGEIF